MKKFVFFILAKFKELYIASSSERYIKHLSKCGIKIGHNVRFRYPEHTKIDTSRPLLIEIGNNVDINDYFTIMAHDFGTFVFRNLYHDFIPSSGKVHIGNNIYFGRNVTILKGVSIGDNCIIGLGSIVTKDIPSNSVACGAPARVICSIDEYYKKRIKCCVNEALEHAAIIRKRNKGQLSIKDLPEEWSLFFRKGDFEIHPEMHNVIDWRLGQDYDLFWQNRVLEFDGFDEFLKAVDDYEK